MTGILNLIIGSLGSRYTIIQTFTATQDWTPPAGVTEVEYLVVGGGGGGIAGGGGAGGYRTGTGLSVTAGQTYTVTLGAGGGNTSNGSNSLFSTITSNGGGGGAQGAPGTAAGQTIRIDTARGFIGIITDVSGGLGVTSSFSADLLRNIGGGGTTGNSGVGIGTTFLSIVA